jgi:PPOX class probable F420-dependent enzyme
MAARASLDDLEPWARALLEEVPTGHLGLLDGMGSPRVLPVTFAIVVGEVWSAVDDKPKRRPGEELARVRWVRARPAAALTVDRYDDDWTRLAWIQLVGRAAVLDVTGHDRVLGALAARYPQYRDRPPRGPLIRLTPERIVCWRAREPRSRSDGEPRIP